MARKKIIDYERCVGCKKCMDDCVNEYLIDINEHNNKRPRPQFKERGICIDCGHCVAICPVNAINYVDEEAKLNDSMLNRFSMKRTTRNYNKNKNIEKEKLDKIICAGQTAPTDRNRKTCRIIFVKDKLADIYGESVKWLVSQVMDSGTINPLYNSTMKMAESDEILWGAEYLILLIGNSQYCVDAAIAAERMQLEADFLGIASAYRGDMKLAINNLDSCKEMLMIKKNEEVLVAFAMGYSEIKYSNPDFKANKKVNFL